MGVFDFETNCVGGNNRIKDECIIAFKVYDSCRPAQDCLAELRLVLQEQQNAELSVALATMLEN